MCPVRLSAREPSGAASAPGPDSVSQGLAPRMSGPRSSQLPKAVWDSRPPVVAVNRGWGQTARACRPQTQDTLRGFFSPGAKGAEG